MRIFQNMEKDKVKLSIVIVNYRSRKNLRKCLLSIRSKAGILGGEIIIVNNDQKERLGGIKAEFPEAKIVQSEENVGFGRAVNLGVKEAKGELLFFLNPDSRIVSDPREIFRHFKKDEDLGVLGARLIDERRKIQKWTAGAEVSFLSIFLNNLGVSGSRKIWKSPEKREVFWVAGTAFFVRREIFLEIGGFDENIFMYFEDVDLCKRVRDAGKKVVYFPEFCVLHLGGKSYQNKKLQKKHYYASQKYYFKKNRPRWEHFLIKFLALLLRK